MGQFDDLIPKGKAGGSQFADLLPKRQEQSVGGVPVSEIPAWQQAAYGLGSAVARPLVGLGQITGLMDDDEVRAAEGRIDAIRDTTPGKVAGAAGDFASLAVPLSRLGALPKAGQYAASIAAGTGIGALDPVTDEGESRLRNTAVGGALGAVGQAAGDAVMHGGKALAKTVAPEVKAIYQAAKARGINLTPAQLSDSKFIGYLRKQLAVLPGSGAAKQVARQQDDFGRAVSQTVGESAPMNREVFDSALTRLGGEFDRFTKRPLPLTNGFMRNVVKIQDEAADFADGDAARNMKAITDRIFKAGTTGTMDGKSVQSIDSVLSQLQRQGGERGHYATQMRNALHDHLEKNMPQADFDAWRQTRGQYANLMKMTGLVAKDDAVSPGKLMGAVTANKAGKRAMARDRGGSLGELAKIGQRMKAPPTSGTAEGVQAAAVGAGFMSNPLGTLAGLTGGRLARGITDSDALASALMNRGQGMQAIAPYMRGLVPAATPAVVPYMAPNDPRRRP